MGAFVFYRHNIPYRITAKWGGGKTVSSLVYSPSESPAIAVPPQRLFIADSDSRFDFADGVLTAHHVDHEGEVRALLYLPAKVLSEYLNQISSLFTNIFGR